MRMSRSLPLFLWENDSDSALTEWGRGATQGRREGAGRRRPVFVTTAVFQIGRHRCR